MSIATPNHTHALIAIAAAEAGKHVYCEKPVSQCVWEGRQIVNASRALRSTDSVRHASSRSSRCNQEAVEYVRSGKLGKIKYVVGTCFKPRPSIGKLDQPLAISKDVDYDLWCGPAAKVDIYRPQSALRLALGFQHRQRRHRQPGPAPDGRRPLVPGRTEARAAGDQRGRPTGLRGCRQHAQFADRAARLRGRAADFRDARLAEVEGRRSDAGPIRWTTIKGSQIGVIVQCEDGYISSSSSYRTVEVFNPAGEQIETVPRRRRSLQEFPRRGRESAGARISTPKCSKAIFRVRCATWRTSRTGWARSGRRRRSSRRSPATPFFAESVDRLLDALAGERDRRRFGDA